MKCFPSPLWEKRGFRTCWYPTKHWKGADGRWCWGGHGGVHFLSFIPFPRTPYSTPPPSVSWELRKVCICGYGKCWGVSLIEGEQSGTSRIVSPLAPCLPPPFFWDKESLECLASPAVSNIQMIGGMVQGRGKNRRKDGGS